MADPQTLRFYAEEAKAYAARSAETGPSKNLAGFLAKLAPGAHVLDLGCGTGRDSLAIREAGFCLTALDGSPENAREAERLLGSPVVVCLFEELDYARAFDAIWANASLLHVPRAEIVDVLRRCRRALKTGGRMFASFKAGEGEARDGLGRLYNYPSEDDLRCWFESAGGWAVLEIVSGEGSGYDRKPTSWLSVEATASGPSGASARRP